SDNNVILGFISLKDNDSLFREGSLQDYIAGISVELGIDLKQAQNFEKNYTDVTAGIEKQRLSVSGVDINEEMVNMIKYQQQYQAAAKLINAIDSIYDTMINRLGV
ncbi:MAG: flagellar hook-associated protein FlgK, partial [Clostridiales bacterium]|nr:flagellar hook-associated protein FlgK [Clostridiales bacterium]